MTEIERLCGSPRSSVMTWCRTYRTEGIAGLLDRRKGGNCAKLQPGQIEQIGVLLHTSRPYNFGGGKQAQVRATSGRLRRWLV